MSTSSKNKRSQNAELVKRTRKHLGENTLTFGERFMRSGRTVEEWEQGRRNPDRLILREIMLLDKGTSSP